MKNEQILAEFNSIAKSENIKAKAKMEQRMQELKAEPRIERIAPKCNIKANFSLHITDVTPKGYGI